MGSVVLRRDGRNLKPEVSNLRFEPFNSARAPSQQSRRHSSPLARNRITTASTPTVTDATTMRTRRRR